MTTEKQEVEHVEALAVTANALEQIERASIDIQIATAHKYPKHKTEQLSKVKADMLSFATLDEETAAACFYTLPRGNKVIQGPSIRMAEIAISCYGNIRDCVRTLEVVDRGPTPHVVVQAVCHDLEKNVAVSIEKRRRITKKKKNQFIDEDDITLAVNAGAAIAFRDAAFKVIPQALIKPVWEAAKKVAVGDLRSIVETRSKCIERLNKMGVTDDRILSVLDCRAIEDIGQPQLEILFGLGTAIKDGDCTLEEAFPKPQAEQSDKSTTERILSQQDHVVDPNKKMDEAKAKEDLDAKGKEFTDKKVTIIGDKSKEPEKPVRKPRSDKGTKRGKKSEQAEEAAPETTAEPETTPEQPEEPKLVKCPICDKEVDSAKPHDCSEPSDSPKTEETPTTVDKDTHKCLRCDRKLKNIEKDIKNGQCAHCHGDIAELK